MVKLKKLNLHVSKFVFLIMLGSIKMFMGNPLVPETSIRVVELS